MNAEIFQSISIAAFICSGILFTLAVFLYFKMDVRAIVDDLSGKTAEKQIRQLREQNRKTPVLNRGIPATAKLEFPENTQQLGQKPEESTVLLQQEPDTVLLEEDTVLLPEPQKYQLLIDEMVIHTEERI